MIYTYAYATPKMRTESFFFQNSEMLWVSVAVDAPPVATASSLLMSASSSSSSNTTTGRVNRGERQ